MRRDRLTFAMILGIPIIQLVLFGYAINTDPKHLPTGVVIGDSGPVARAIVAGMQTSGYFRIDGLSERRRRRARACGWHARLRRHRAARLSQGSGSRPQRPQIVIEADATDPTASANAIAAMPEIVSRAVAAATDGRSAAARRPAAPMSSSTASTIRKASTPTTSCRV